MAGASLGPWRVCESLTAGSSAGAPGFFREVLGLGVVATARGARARGVAGFGVAVCRGITVPLFAWGRHDRYREHRDLTSPAR